MADIEYTLFERDGLEDFVNLMLPNIYGYLEELDDFDDMGIVCIGALDGDIPVGALVFQLLDDAMLSILSIFVSNGYRRLHIASDMFKNALGVALEEFEPTVLEEASGVNIPVNLTAYTEYAMEDTEYTAFEAFLKASGFTEFNALDEFCIIEGKEVLKFVSDENTGSTNAALTRLSDSKTAKDGLDDLFELMGYNAEPEYSYFAGSEDKPSALAMIESNGNDYYITSHVFDDDISEKVYAELIATCVRSIMRKEPEMVLIAGGDRNAFADMWHRMAETSGKICRHTEAQMFAQFN